MQAASDRAAAEQREREQRERDRLRQLLGLDKKAKPEPVRDPDGLLTSSEAAAQLGITVEQLIAHVDDGTIRAINVGRGKIRPRYRFDPADLDVFKTSRTKEHKPCPSSSPKRASRTTGSASSSNVVGFSALHAARLAKKPSGSKR
jgi:excisionase family DNA binding protein